MATFPLDIRTELQLGGTWTDVSSDVYVREAKQITRGLRDQGSAADPSTLTFTLNNRAGKYSRRNAMGPLFGLLQQNTPVRVSIPGTGDSYLQLDGSDTGYAYTADKASLDITGDFDARIELAGNWYGPANQWLMGKWATGQHSWALYMYQGWLYFQRISDGDLAGLFYRRPLPALPERAALRVTLDADNGAGNHVVTFYWADSLDSSTWNLIDQPIVANGIASIFAGTAPLQIGVTEYRPNTAANLQRRPLDGRVYRAEVRNGIGGSVVASPDFRALADRATSTTDAQANVWALSGNAEIRHREDRFVGEISEWPLKWSTDDADRWTPVQANGIMRRLGQGAKAIDSALRRRIPSGDPVAYWPLEESQDATRAYSPIPGVFPASMTGVEWASLDTLPSSLPLPRLSDSAAFSATVPESTPGAWQIEFVYNADDKPPAAETQIINWQTTGPVRRWEIKLKLGRAHVLGYNVTNTAVIDQGITIGADVFHGWVRLRFWAQDKSGGGFDWRINWQDVGGDAGGFTGTYGSSSCGMITAIAGDWTSAATQGWGVGHIFVLDSSNSTLIDGSDNAYLGETAWVRMRRLADEEGIKFSRMPGALPVEPVGFQRSDQLLNLFEAAANGDGGLLTEDPHRIGLHYRDRSSMYTQTPQLTLSYVAPGLGPDLEPVDDDTAVVNDVTVTRDGGSSARAVLAEGPLSTQAPPNGIGKYDTSFTLSLGNDDQTEPVAAWRLHLGTWDGARYPTVTLMLHKPGAESLIPAVLDLREGDKIRLTNLPEWVSHDDVDLIVLGWSETLDLYRWEVTLNCVSAGPWNTAVTDHTVYGKADTDGSSLAEAMTATDTTAYVRVTAGPHWTADPAFMPVPIRVAGEVMNVTAATEAPADTFENRTLTGSWGTSLDGLLVWSTNGGTVGTDYGVSGGLGKHIHTSKGITRRTFAPVPQADTDTLAAWSWDKVPAGDSQFHALLARYADTNNHYFARVLVNVGGSMVLSLRKRVAGVEAAIGSTFTLPGTYTANAKYWLRFRVRGTTLSAKCWADGTAEPSTWQLTGTDTALSASGSVGVLSFINTASTLTFPTTLSLDVIDLQFQAFTVTRSVNGVVKAQAAGTAIALANPAITSL